MARRECAFAITLKCPGHPLLHLESRATADHQGSRVQVSESTLHHLIAFEFLVTAFIAAVLDCLYQINTLVPSCNGIHNGGLGDDFQTPSDQPFPALGVHSKPEAQITEGSPVTSGSNSLITFDGVSTVFSIICDSL